MNLFPHIFQNGWTTLPIEIIRAFSGRSRLPVYECDESDVRTPYRRVPLSTAQPENLSFSAWRLAHAVKKADCARWPSSRILWSGAFGFLLENVHIFDWNPTEFRLGTGMSGFYADFSRTSLSGRIGQGMALLFLENRGYTYVGRFPTVLDQYGFDSKISGKVRGKSRRSPDFIVEKDHKEWALAEAKGSFISPGNPASAKKALRGALDQLDGWDRCFSPQPHKGFAIGTFLRETEDLHNGSSLTAFVETGPGKPQAPVELPQDAIRRTNYVSWLSLMGLDDAAHRLRVRRGEPEQRTVPLLTLGGRQYVVAITSIRPSYRHHAHDPDFRRLIQEGMRWIFGLWRDGVTIEIIGLDSDVVHALGTTLWKPESQALMEIGPIDPPESRDDSVKFDGGEFHGSFFSDGSLFGELRISDMDWSGIEPTEVTL